MVEVRPNPDLPPRLRSQSGSAHGAPQADHRLNLLLSYAGWQDHSWADSLPTLLEPMGVRTRRVRSGREATTLLQHEPIHIAIVDLNLPLAEPEPASAPNDAAPIEPGGERLLQLLARLEDQPPIVVVRRRRARRDTDRELTAALQHGAFAAIDEPVSIETMLELMRRILTKRYRDRWPDCRPPA